MIAEIKAGKIESSKLDAKYAAIEKLASAEHDKEADSLNALHEALDPTQRKTVVASVRAKVAKRDERMAKLDAGAPPVAADGGKPPSAMKRRPRWLGARSRTSTPISRRRSTPCP